MSNRMTNQEKPKGEKSRQTPDFSKYRVHDSYSLTESLPSSSGSAEVRRLSKRRLEELELTLGERDKNILLAIQRHRYLMTKQIQRLYFVDAVSPTAALRATGRSLKKLRELGLIDALSRRIGGVRAGSGSLIWYLTHAGERFMRLHDYRPYPSKRFFEPSPFFLAHTLAVSELVVRLQEICREDEPQLHVLEPEPECWRSYSEYGKHLSLKPDLYAVTVSGKYEDRWFFEVDLATESPSKVIEKCQRYHKYYQSGLEQKTSGVFPLTVWLVPDTERKERLIAHIKAFFQGQPRLFSVITMEELEELICQGGNGDTLC